jgi:hypothetical protein
VSAALEYVLDFDSLYRVHPQIYAMLTFNQGICAIPSPVINSELQLRLGMCGTPLVRSGEYLEDESYLRQGHIAGFMSLTDIPGHDVAGKLYAYSQIWDPLIRDGWEVCGN